MQEYRIYARVYRVVLDDNGQLQSREVVLDIPETVVSAHGSAAAAQMYLQGMSK
jgi:hypothetical protein